ncbi:baseplate J/gp47 family protein [Rufibacter sediminis]|uniref:Baseplate J/gp47 family protein n=1 Tax=Rufibacter sediminis TaxID=2762756 RepID=A0ABR6VUW4_9BACT|nr:baseplate J/gp47 family protein [Rufibacter sediminis]MBC3540667.1 baseplate J/gp47 family protein [Rufibacter sediminis]
MAGLTRYGFKRKSFTDIKLEIENALKTVLGNEIDLRAESVLGQIVGVLTLPISDLWEELENVYLSFDPDYAEGVSLDSLAALTGVTRIPATSTEVDAVLYGAVGTVIPINSEARNTQTEDIYLLASPVTISLNNLARALVTVNTVSNTTDYTITVNGTDYTVTSGAVATKDDILLALAAELADEPVFSQVNVQQQVVLAGEPFTLSVSANLTISNTGSMGVFVAKEPGAKFVPAGTLSVIQTPVAGWTSVMNPGDGVTGRNIETDPELRLRRRQSVSYPATGTVDAIRSKLLQVSNIQSAVVIENDSGSVDEHGVPPQHIWAIVQGGDDDVIADILYRTKAGGIGTYGDTLVEYEAVNGQTYDVRFERPQEIDLYIDMTIKPLEGYPLDAVDQIKAAITAWASSNMSIGEGLRYSRLFTPINSVPGFEVTELLIGTEPNPASEASISVDVDEIIISDTANINITVI